MCYHALNILNRLMTEGHLFTLFNALFLGVAATLLVCVM